MLPVILRRHKLAPLQTALHKVHIPRLVQFVMLPSSAPKHHLPAAELLQNRPNILQQVLFPTMRDDTLERQRRVRIEHLEQACGAGEVIDDFGARGVSGAVAGGRERIDAGSVLVVLVHPEIGVGAAVSDPVPVHEGEQVGLVIGGEDIGDIVETGRHLAGGVMGPVAEVRPVRSPPPSRLVDPFHITPSGTDE